MTRAGATDGNRCPGLRHDAARPPRCPMTTDRLPVAFARRILAAGLLGLAPAAVAAQAPLPVPMAPAKGQPAAQPPAPKPAPANTLTVGECVAIGLDRQPAMRVALESLKSAEQGRKAMNNLPLVA